MLYIYIIIYRKLVTLFSLNIAIEHGPLSSWIEPDDLAHLKGALLQEFAWHRDLFVGQQR